MRPVTTVQTPQGESRRPSAWLIASAALCWVLCSAGAVAAEGSPDERPEVERLIKEGLDLRGAGRHEEAVQRFERAAALEKSARTLGHLGLAEEEMQHWAKAEEYLKGSLSSKESKWLGQHREMLEKQLAVVGGHVGDLIIIGTTGASVAVNGRFAGFLPLTKKLRVNEGNVVVTAVAEGYEPFRQTQVVTGGGTASVEASLRRVADSADAPLVIATPRVEGRRDRKEVERVPRWVSRVTLGLTAAALVASGVVWKLDGELACDRRNCMDVYRSSSGVKFGLPAAAVVGGVFTWWTW
jgi:hypothetical protein